MKPEKTAFALRDAVPDDAETIARLVRELAEYEKLAQEAVATGEDFHAALFGANPRAHAMIADVDAAPVGLALYFFNFSTFVGRHGLYVEDVFVRPAHRGRGIGRAFFQTLAARALAEGCARMEWSVLDWNKPALKFYQSLGADPMSDWTIQRLTGGALRDLAAQAPERLTVAGTREERHQAHQAIPHEIDSLARTVVDAGLRVHTALGPGLLESTYQHCLAHELGRRGLSFVRQVPLRIIYEGEQVAAGFCLDIVVENAIILEIKSVESLPELYEAQLLTYLKFSGFRLGLLMNFNVPRFTQGLRRIVK